MKGREGQTMIEYMLLLGMVVVIVLAAFKTLVPKTYNAADLYFNTISNGIMGPPVNEIFLYKAGDNK
ncbi:MAG: hypothetical protein WC552_07625 [Candidatus Omnitrophota bacterium]